MKKVAFIMLLTLAAATASAGQQRSYQAKREFARAVPCPSTWRYIPHCPGYVIDHVVPLCAGGADTPVNMQWQNREQSLVKDREERRLCAALRRNGG